MVNIAINGFGRIGRLILRKLIELKFLDNKIKVVAINDLTDAKTLAHLLKYDSTQGTMANDVIFSSNEIIIDNHKIKVFSEKEPKNLKWKELNVDIVIEATGFFCSEESAQEHLNAGAKKVLITAPAKGNVKTIVYGVNDHELTKKDNIISGASCTTNCLAPIVKAINDKFKIASGLMTTIHGYTGDQRILDAPHKDLRRARAAAINIVPTSTGAAKAIGLVVPEVDHKLNGFAIRVPVATGSLIDLTFTTNIKTSKQEINEAINIYATNHHDVVKFCTDPIVSSDIIGSNYASIFDAELTQEIEDDNGNKMFKVISWYDNELSYVSQFVRLLNKVINL